MARTRREVVHLDALGEQQRRWERSGFGTPMRVSRPVRAQGTAEDALAETLGGYEHPEEPEGVASGYARLAGALSGRAPAGDGVGEDRHGPEGPSG